MKFYIPLLLSASPLFTTAMARTFTVTNNCPFTIWPAIFTDQGKGAAPTPNQPTGWKADAHTTVSFAVPDNWKAGRIWGRRNCDFGTNPGQKSCLTGGCDGGLVCDIHTGIALPPTTHAEFSLSDAPNVADFYDISLVDGYNLPMRVDNNKGCGVPLCNVDLGLKCPPPLKGPTDDTGFTVGCNSACSANLVDHSNSPNCCTGKFNTDKTCPSSGVQSYDYFKKLCPTAYAYAFDDATALFNCPSTLKADYTITFCPP